MNNNHTSPHAGAVCRLHNQIGLWMPYAPICVRSAAPLSPAHRWRFASYPEHDALRTLPLTDVLEVVHEADSEESIAFRKRHNLGETNAPKLEHE